MAELLVVTFLAGMVTDLLDRFFQVTLYVPSVLWLVLLSVIIGGIATTFLSRAFFQPITKLGQAMSRVAEGDLDVRLKTGSAFQEIKDIYGNFNLMTQELRATEILQTDFVSNVSHEFKTPINAIEGYATLLQDDEGNTPAERRQYVDKILLNTRRLSSLVGNILLLSKVDHQAIQTGQTTYRLDEQVRQAILMSESEWVEKEVEFDVELDAVEYTGSEALMTHVWSNLIGNAIKFGPRGGLIRMSLKQEAGEIRYLIEDSGPGINETVRKHMFDKFYQGDSSHKEEGNGLGLALVKEILTACGGTITAENRQSGGCRFVVTLKT
jgi:signal transduction histidine kinase